MLPYAHYIHLVSNQNQLSKEIARLAHLRLKKLKDLKHLVEDQTSNDVSTVIVSQASMASFGRIVYQSGHFPSIQSNLVQELISPQL